MSEHILTMSNGGAANCNCGGWEGVGKIDELVKLWRSHIESFNLLLQVHDSVRVEQTARIESENIIHRLLEMGVSSRVIASAIGTNKEGKPLMSLTTIQRLGRGDHEQAPRRRRR